MSHQSGIQVSEDLSKLFAEAVFSGTTRIIRVSIEKESLVPNGTTPAQDGFEADYKKSIGEYLETTTPAYIFVRLDEKSSTGEYKWVFLCYIPDNAKVRDKMIYASTRATLTRELGDYRFIDSIYGTDKSEFTWDGYKKHLAHKAAEAPLTRREQDLVEIKAAEAKTASEYQGTTTRKAYVTGIAFPFTEKATEALSQLTKAKGDRSSNYVSLYLNNEKIDLDNTSEVSINDLKNTITNNAPRFTFYIYEKESKESIIFIYTCPSSSKIRERMLYSSSKAGVITAAENEASVTVIKKFETSDLSDLTSDYFSEELDNINKTASSQQQSDSNGGSGASTPSGSFVGDRIQMLGGTQQGFKRPVAPGRRRPQASSAPTSSSSITTENTTSSA